MEGADWETLIASEGGLGAQVVDGKVNTRFNRGLMKSLCSVDGVEYWRWNKCIVGDFALGP